MSSEEIIGPDLPVTVAELRSVFRRHGYHWKEKDVKKVCRQYIKGESIAMIAARNGRSPNSIMFVLTSEGYFTPVPLADGQVYYVDTKTQLPVCKEMPIAEVRQYVRQMINVLQ